MTDEAASQRSVRALVLGRDIRTFLSVIRFLRRASPDFHAGMCPSDDLALKSRYIKHVHDIPNYDEAPEVWLGTIIGLARRHHFDLIIPTQDESTIPVQIHQDRLHEEARVYARDAQVFDVAADKIKSSLLVEWRGMRIARQNSVELSSLETGFPMVLIFRLSLNHRRRMCVKTSRTAAKFSSRPTPCNFTIFYGYSDKSLYADYPNRPCSRYKGRTVTRNNCSTSRRVTRAPGARS